MRINFLFAAGFAALLYSGGIVAAENANEQVDSLLELPLDTPLVTASRLAKQSVDFSRVGSSESPRAKQRPITADPQALDSNVSRSFLRAAFTMRARRWPNGQTVRVFVHKQDHPAHQQLCKTVLNMYPYQLRRSWDRLVYSGTGQAPVEVASESEMRAKVAQTPGALGYVLNSEGDGVVVIAH